MATKWMTKAKANKMAEKLIAESKADREWVFVHAFDAVLWAALRERCTQVSHHSMAVSGLLTHLVAEGPGWAVFVWAPEASHNVIAEARRWRGQLLPAA